MCKDIFFLSGFSFTDTDNSQDSRGREGTFFYSSLPLSPTHEHSDIHLQLRMRDDYHVFLIATPVFTKLLDLPPYWITIWLIDWWCNISFFTWWFDSRFFVTAVWHGKPIDLNSHRLPPLYYKRTD